MSGPLHGGAPARVLPMIEEAERTGEPLPDWVRKDEGILDPEDHSGLIVFLASDESSKMTGQVLVNDAGTYFSG